MKKVKFYFIGRGIEYVEETVEFNDNTTDREINEELESWLWDKSQASWEYIEDNCND